MADHSSEFIAADVDARLGRGPQRGPETLSLDTVIGMVNVGTADVIAVIGQIYLQAT